MSFTPVITNPFAGTSKYITLATQSFAASSSLGPVQLGLLQNNSEWLYHYGNSQTLLNWQGQNVQNGKAYGNTAQIVSTRSINLGQFGPMRINLDKDGQPQPLEVYYSGIIQDNNGATSYQITGTFTFSIMAQKEFGPWFSSQNLIRQTTSINFTTASQCLWYGVTASTAPIGYTVTDSIGQFYVTSNNRTKLPTRSTRSLTQNDVSQQTMLAYLNASFTIDNFVTGSGTAFVWLTGLYVREVCGLKI